MGRRRKRTVPRTFVVIVQDKSGSMESKTEATISGFNEYKNTLRHDAEGEVLLTLTQFDTRVSRVHSAVPISDVPDLNRGSYVAGGMTALYDAVGQAVRDAERAARKSDRVLVVIMTDGGENSSNEWRHDGILSLFEAKRRAEWEFVFLGAGEESWATGESLGFNQSNSIRYRATPGSHRTAFAAMAGTTSDYSRGIGTVQSLAASPLKQSLETEAGTVNIDLTPQARALFSQPNTTTTSSTNSTIITTPTKTGDDDDTPEAISSKK